MKKTLSVIGIVFGVLLLILLGSSALILHISKVQTFFVGIVTEKLSAALHADVQLQHIHYRPLNHLTFDSLYISDQQRDTLAFIERADIAVNLLQLRKNRLELTNVQLQNPYVNIQSINDSTLNCQFLIDALQPTDTATFPLRVNIDQLQFTNSRIRYNNLLVNHFDLSIAIPVLSTDSLDLAIHNLSLHAQLDELDAKLTANLHGSLDSIFADRMLLEYREQCLFDGNVAIYHPTELDSLYIQANCNDLYCNPTILKNILSQLHAKAIILPHSIHALGHIHYRGDIVGRLEHTDLHGTFTSQLGSIKVNGSLEADTTFSHFDWCGHVSTNGFHIGKILNQPDLGEIAFDAHLDGKLDSLQLIHCIADATIKTIEYRDYTYTDIHFKGEQKYQEVQGAFSIHDENIALNINGLADWSSEDTQLDITAQLSDFRPAAIHLIDQYPDMVISGTTSINLSTSGKASQMLDNLTGYVIIDTLDIQNGDKQAVMEQMKVVIDNNKKDKHRQLYIQSDYLTANLSGKFQYTTLPNTIEHLIHAYLPAIMDKPKKLKRTPNDVNFYAYFRELNQLTEVFDLGVQLPLYPTIKGFLHESDQQMGVQAYIPKIGTSGTQLEDITFSLDNFNDVLDMSLYVYNRLPKDNPTAAKIGDVKAHIDLLAANNEIDVNISLDNTDSVRNTGNINISTLLQRYANKPLANVHIHPTEIMLNDSTWNIKESYVTYNASERIISIEDFALNTDYQSISINGIASSFAEDSIQVEMHNIALQYLLGYTLVADAILINGPLTGHATIHSLLSDPMVSAQVAIPQVGLNNTYLGDLTAEAYFDYDQNAIIIDGNVIDSTMHQVLLVEGKVLPQEKWWGLDIHCDSVDIALINHWTNTFLSNPTGRGYGDLQVFGLDKQTWVTAKLRAKDAHVTVPQLGATFHFNDSILMDSTAIRIPKATLYDSEGHRGQLQGVITHNNFLNMQYDIDAHVDTMLVMNLPYEPQALFYGKVYGTGDLNIHGNDAECKISVNARTESNSKFYLSVNTASVATSSSFIQFTDPDTTSYQLLKLLDQPQKPQPRTTTPTTRVLLALQLEATPTTDIFIKMGGDDGIHGRGEGNIQLNYDDASGNIHMLGTYTLQSGLFSFSLGNIVRRNFDIAEGSSVTWSGDPLSPTVNITGRYHTTASLRDLFGSDLSQVSTNRTSVPVNCVLYMTEQLFDPILKFAVELPQSDESVQSQINSIINTEEMLMRQVIYLLVFNRFYTPDYMQSTQTVGLNETYSLLSSTITGQINSWLSKLTDVFTMGFNFRTDGEGETASQEYEANFQIRPINQLIINGNFGYRYNDISNRPFFGDLDIEYLLTPNGKLRAKAYTHTVDKYSLKQANTVQGIGLIFKHDFNWPMRKDKDKIRTKKTKKDRK